MKLKEKLEQWNVKSPIEPGFHEVISPSKKECKVSYIYRLNLNKDDEYTLESKDLEMNLVLIKGQAVIEINNENKDMTKYDSLYIPGKSKLNIRAIEQVTFYIGAATCEGIGKVFFRKFDKTLPLGEIHQIHGSGSGEREVFFTLNPEVPASRLICGLTWGGDGTWTSWPPHQHEKDLEEVYCYFDMDFPKIGFHLSYVKEGGIESGVLHPVTSGSMIMAPYGYHPTVATPGTRNSYFWVLVAFTPETRAYDRAIIDKNYVGGLK
ncbi:5-deoxy-glucuronate isomerase [Cetobacterium sp.]|uniref:5-deoxy-glucuronate isomerase n=1 Tax=Cetobacterium sp. TaxID=2071632 RepID=UPI003EE7E262